MKTKTKRSMSKMLALLLTLCLAAGALPFIEPVFAASEFKYPSPFSKTGYDTYYHNGRFANNLIVNGVDISDWQSKKCRFADAKAAGVDYAIMRVSWTSYGRSDLVLHNDDNFASQYKNAKANGVMAGVYVFSQAKNATEGAKEAAFAIKRLQELGIGPKDLSLPVYMDYEFAGGVLGRMHGISRTAATNAAVAFCNTIKAAGYTPGIYANTTFFSSYIVPAQFAPDVDFWCAQYYKRNQSAVNYTKWQYSSSARINGMLSYTGLQGKIDADFWYLNKNNAESSVAKIYGKTKLTVSEAKAPKFTIKSGDKVLKEGKDYSVGGIRNNAAGNGYAYIKGIGSYAGYALVPLTITKTSAKSAEVRADGDEPADSAKPEEADKAEDAAAAEDGEKAAEGAKSAKAESNADQEISCANYLTKASTATSTYISTPTVDVRATDVKSLVGKKQKFYIKVFQRPKANASGYQVKYSRNKNMSDSVTKTIGSKYNKVSNTIKTNARKRYYYLQVRTYKDSGGIRYYSSWSKVWRVKVK